MFRSILRSLNARRGYMDLIGMRRFRPALKANDDLSAPPPVEAGEGLRGTGPIMLRNVTMNFGTGRKPAFVFENANAVFPQGRAIGVLGAQGSGKTTLVNLLNGNAIPTSGAIARGMSVSWPIAARDILSKPLTIRSNIRIISGLYGAWPPDMIEAVREMAKIRAQDMDKSFLDLVPDILSRVSVSLCLALDFDCYVADETWCSGSRSFRDHVRELLLERKKTHTLIFVTKNLQSVRDMCDDFYVLHDRGLRTFASKGDAIRAFKNDSGGEGAARSADDGED